MKITQYQNREEWLEARVARITGSRLKDIIVERGTAMKDGYYELIAEQLALPPDGENAMDRGNRLEEFAIAEFEKATGKKVDTSLVIWERDENGRIAISPDGAIFSETGIISEAVVIGSYNGREAVEAKCLKSSKHLKALITQSIPTEYLKQSFQYFIVNDQLETLYFAFYDPRLSVQQFFYLTITRADVQATVDKYLEAEHNVLASVDAQVIILTKDIF